MTKTRSRFMLTLLFAAIIFAVCFLCFGFASLQDGLDIEGNVDVETKSAVLSKTKFRNALRDQNVTQIQIGNSDDLQSANLSLDDLGFVADVSDAEQGFGNSIGFYTLGNIAYVLASGNGVVAFPADSAYMFASYKPAPDDPLAESEDVVPCLKNVTSIDFGNADFGLVDMNDVLSMYRMFFHCEKLTEIELPDSVTLVAQAMFRGCYELESVKISDQVTQIGEVAFGDCHKLSRINEPDETVASCNLPQTVTSIGKGAFLWCGGVENADHVLEGGIEHINIPDGVTKIEDEVFYGCYKLKNVTIPNDVTSIGVRAFSNCYDVMFDHIAIPARVTSIGEEAFDTCSGLKSLTMADGVTKIGSRAFNNCWRLSEITVSDRIAEIGENVFTGCPIANATIPGIVAKSVNSIDFNDIDGESNINANLKSVTVTSGAIENQAFARCSALTSITIQSGVTSIGNQAFYKCWGFSAIEIPGSVTSIGDHAFDNCGALSSVSIRQGVTSIGTRAFNNCWLLPAIEIPGSVKSIGESAFSTCNALASVTLGNGITNIGKNAFYACDKLTRITVPDSVESVASDAFAGCKIAEASIPAVAAAAVNSGYLTNVVITSGNAIAADAFSGCWALLQITIPSSVTSIGKNAFLDCWQLGEIIFRGTQTQWNNIAKDAEWKSANCNPTITYTA